MRGLVVFVMVFVLLIALCYLVFAGSGVLRRDGTDEVVVVPVATVAPAPTERPGEIVFSSIADLEARGGLIQPGQAFRLRIGEDELNERARAYLGADAPIREPSLDLRPGAIVLSGQTTVLGMDADVIAIGEPRVEGGHARIVVTDIRMGDLPVPGFARQSIADTVDERVAAAQDSIRAVVDDIRIGDGFIEIAGRAS